MSDVKFIDATGWNELSWYNSGGTRAKRVLQSPDNKEWFFKCSEKKEAKDGKPAKYYRFEFWSEILAYQLGELLKLDVLRYDAAIYADQIGCISENMIVTDKEQLIEVGRFMTAINDEFSPEINQTRNQYTFQLLDDTLKHFELSKFMHLFFQTLLFDVIIGNTDRHQENWAFIGKTSFLSNVLDQLESQAKEFNKGPSMLKKIYLRYVERDKNELKKEFKEMRLQVTNILRMAPIYDNGSSLPWPESWQTKEWNSYCMMKVSWLGILKRDYARYIGTRKS